MIKRKKMVVDKIVLDRGITIRPGDYLELGNLVGDKYKLTWHYDKDLELPYEIHKHDDFDFNCVELMPNELSRFKEIELHYQYLPVYKLLSGFRDQVQAILIQPDHRKIIRTTYFEVDIEKALAYDEVIILPEALGNTSAETDLLADLQDIHEHFTLGLLTYEELMQSFEDQYLYYYVYSQTKWEVRYRSIFKGGMFGNGIDDL